MAVPYVFTPGTTISSAQVNANFAALGGGAGGTGVTDGSDAAPGQVGEYIYSVINTTPASGTYATIGTVALSAGDWDCSGQIEFHATAPFNNGYVQVPGLDDSYAGLQTSTDMLTDVAIALPTIRVSTATATVFQLQAHLNTAAGPVPTGGTVSGSLRFRRMR